MEWLRLAPMANRETGNVASRGRPCKVSHKSGAFLPLITRLLPQPRFLETRGDHFFDSHLVEDHAHA